MTEQLRLLTEQLRRELPNGTSVEEIRRRGRHRRRVRKGVIAAGLSTAAVIAVVAGTLVIDNSDGSTRIEATSNDSTQPGAAPSQTVPPGWTQSFTPSQAPSEATPLFTISTFEPPEPSPTCVGPAEAVRAMTSTDVYIQVLERYPSYLDLPRREHFEELPTFVADDTLTCNALAENSAVARNWDWVRFAVDDRSILVRVAYGTEATPEQRTQALMIVNTIATSDSNWSFERIVDPFGMRESCLRLTVHGHSRDACISLPGTSIWRVEGEDYTIRGGPKGVQVAPLSAQRDEMQPNVLEECATTSLIASVDQHFGGESDPFLVTACTPAFALVDTQPLEPSATTSALMFQRDGARWTFLASVDFEDTDRERRCSSLPTEIPSPGQMSARDLCQLLG